VALALFVAHALSLGLLGAHGPGPVVSDLLQLAMVLLAVFSCFASARRQSGFSRHFFALVGAGFTLWAAGQGSLIYYLYLLHHPNPPASPSDVFFFAYFIPLAAALVLHQEQQDRRVNWILTLDFAQVGILIVAVYLNFLFFIPALASGRLEVLRSVTDVYSVFDVLLAGGFLLRTVLSGPGSVRGLYARFTLVLWTYAIGSFLWGYAFTVRKAPMAGTWVDLGYSLPFLLAAVSAATWKTAADEPPPSAQLRRRDALVQALPMLGPIFVLLLAMHELSTNFLTAVTIIVASFVCYTARLWMTQAALRSSEAQFRVLSESSLASILIFQDNRFVYANPAAEAISGYSREELLSMDPGTLLAPESVEKVTKRVAARLRGEEPSGHLELKFLRKDGRERWMDTTGATIRFNGQFAVLSTGFDITERKWAEEALRASEEKFATAFRSAPDSMTISTLREGRYVEANDRFLQIYGYTRGELVGQSALELNVWADPQDRAALLERLQREGRAQDLEVRLRTKSGEVRQVQLSAECIELEGETYLVAGSRDITERKVAEEALRRSEEKFAKAFRSNPDAITISTLKDGHLLEVNEGFLRLYGYSREEVFTSSTLELGIWEDPRDRETLVTQLLEHGSVAGLEAHMRTKLGAARVVLFSAETIELAGEPCVVIVARDVTERRQLEEQFRQAQKMEAVGRLAGGIAHDFNNLLTIIRGHSDLAMLELEAGSNVHDSLTEVQKAADRASGLTRQLLAFSRQQVLEPRIINLNHVVRDTEKMLRRLIGEDVELVSRLAPDLKNVKADPGQMEQVIMNLVVNARDAMPTGGRLTLETSNVELTPAFAEEHPGARPGACVMLAVSDTGCGVDEATRGRIFEPFFTTKEMGKGTGLGLSTVYGIVKQSEGYITVESEVGRGSTFRIYLPQAEAKAVAAAKAPADPVSSSSGSETILVVEDEDALRELARRFLENSGYTVLAAGQGAEALEVARQHRDPIHLVVCDAVLPGINGRELAGQLRSAHPEAKVLFVSGYTDDALLLHGIAGDGTPFLQKPFTSDALLRKVRQVLNPKVAI
jgi:PAS domain S-box-containing protein